VDGRVTVVAYALGEESFIDLNGNNVYDAGEPFQDLGNIFKDRNFDGVYDPTTDEFVPWASTTAPPACPAATRCWTSTRSIPSIPGTCSGS
jgi:hypothetical protein